MTRSGWIRRLLTVPIVAALRTRPLLAVVALALLFLLSQEDGVPVAEAHGLSGTSLVVQHSGKCMDVQWGSTADGAPIWQWPCNGSPAQQIDISDLGSGWHQLKFRNSGKCLDVWSGSHDPGAMLWQWPCNGSDAQKFTVPSGFGYTSQIKNKGSGLCVQVRGASTADQALLEQAVCGSGSHQKWTSMPRYAHSWYISETGTAKPDATTMYNLGRSDGAFDNSKCANSLVVLNFGQPDAVGGNYGTNYWPSNEFISDAAILNLVENYARGWYYGTGSCPRLKLVVGTNNYHQNPSGGTPYTAGGWWAAVVYALQSYLSSTGFSSQITAWAGSDMEQPSGGEAWDCADRTRQFVDGYNNDVLGTQDFLDYGTAWVPNSCWTAYDVYYVAYGAARDFPLPEIYTGYATDSWVSVRTSYYMFFRGVMTECQQGDPLPFDYCTSPSDQFAPQKAWLDLWTELNANGVGQSSLQYSTNITWEQ